MTGRCCPDYRLQKSEFHQISKKRVIWTNIPSVQLCRPAWCSTKFLLHHHLINLTLFEFEVDMQTRKYWKIILVQILGIDRGISTKCGDRKVNIWVIITCNKNYNEIEVLKSVKTCCVLIHQEVYDTWIAFINISLFSSNAINITNKINYFYLKIEF